MTSTMVDNSTASYIETLNGIWVSARTELLWCIARESLPGSAAHGASDRFVAASKELGRVLNALELDGFVCRIGDKGLSVIGVDAHRVRCDWCSR